MERLKNITEAVIKQILPIIISALVAALFAYVQSLVQQWGLCPKATVSPEQVAILGGTIKAGHQTLSWRKNIV